MSALKGLLAFAFLVTGTALIYWPAAFLVAGALLLFDAATD